MAALYEYVIALIWGEDKQTDTLADEEMDSLDNSVHTLESALDAIGSESRIVIRKSMQVQTSQPLKAVPTMIIKEPEPRDSYDARVFAAIFIPAGIIIGLLGMVMAILAFTKAAGFPYKESVAFAVYGKSLTLLAPLLVGFGVTSLMVGVLAVLCTPHSRRLPFVYLKAADDPEVEEELPHSVNSRRVSFMPQTATSGVSTVASGDKIVNSGSSLGTVRSHMVV